MTSKVRFLANPLRRPRLDPPAPAPALDFHRSLAGYAPTPLHAAPDLARAWGVGEVWLKDETERLGLPAFKVIGASWAAQRAVQEFSAMELVTATAGNHGRAVARVARLLGLRAYVLVPGGTAAARIEAIRAEGATVEVEPAGYDVAVERAAALAAADPARVLVQDTSWPGYEEIPAWIVEGYATIFAELDVEPDVVVLPVGVGSFATAAVRALPGAKVISVEPADAACLLESLAAGEPVEAPAPHRSIMAGLNSGRVSTAAWPVLREAVDVAVAVGDDTAVAGMRTLAQLGIRGGECSGAVVGAAAELLSGPRRDELAVGAAAVVLLPLTEGVTDPDGYARRVGA